MTLNWTKAGPQATVGKANQNLVQFWYMAEQIGCARLSIKLWKKWVLVKNWDVIIEILPSWYVWVPKWNFLTLSIINLSNLILRLLPDYSHINPLGAVGEYTVCFRSSCFRTGAAVSLFWDFWCPQRLLYNNKTGRKFPLGQKHSLIGLGRRQEDGQQKGKNQDLLIGG